MSTQKVVECGKFLDIEVVDHIVVGAITGRQYSMLRDEEITHITQEEREL